MSGPGDELHGVDPSDIWRPDELMTGEAVALDLRPTSFVLAAAGAAIDYLVYFGAFVIALVVLFMLAGSANAEDSVYGILGVVSMVTFLVVAPATVELLSRGKSLGRLAVGARIVRDDGGAIGFRHVAIRSIAGVLDFYFSFGGVALLVGLLSPRSKRLGDLIAGTYSQYERVGRLPAAQFGMPAELTAWATVADVARMPEGLSRRVSQFLTQAPQLDPARRQFQAASLAQEVSAFVSPVPRVSPELFLAGVTVMRRTREAAALASAARRLESLQTALTAQPHGFPDRG